MTVLNASGPRIGSLWQQRMDGICEYEVVRDGNVFATGFSNRFVCTSEHDTARQYLADLLGRYAGRSIEEVFPEGREYSNDGGACFLLENSSPLCHPDVDPDTFLSALFDDLTLVRGIGKATETKLRVRGYRNLWDLMKHPKFRIEAERIAGSISGAGSAEIMEIIGKRHSRSHLKVLGTACLHEPEELVFLDIETMGLFSRPIILFGIGFLKHHQLVIRQYLVRDVAEEPAALLATMEHFSMENPALVTFNGKAFDAPYISDRLAYYGMESIRGIPHYDVLHFSRRRWKDRFPSLRLSALENEILDVHRGEDVPGQMVPEFYETYLRSGNSGPLVPIIEHNRQDVESLARLFFSLMGDVVGNC